MKRVRHLPPSAARTFYNAADALLPPGAGPGAGDVDLAIGLEARLAHWSAWRRAGFVALLALLEASPRLSLRGGFSWLSREERARRLERLEHGPLLPLRAAARALRGLVGELWREAQSRAGA
jgi:hypothetical protein